MTSTIVEEDETEDEQFAPPRYRDEGNVQPGPRAPVFAMRKSLAIATALTLWVSCAMAFETPRVTAYCVGERKDDAATRHPEWMTPIVA